MGEPREVDRFKNTYKVKSVGFENRLNMGRGAEGSVKNEVCVI